MDRVGVHNAGSVKLTNCHLVDTNDDATYRIRRDHEVVVVDGLIEWIGPRGVDHRIGDFIEVGEGEIIDCAGSWVTAGLVDCHTHLIYGGSRVGEFEERLSGASYGSISRAGRGILSTVAATRTSTAESLLNSAKGRLAQMARWGATTVEIKSGYGLDLDSERTMLEVATQLDGYMGITVIRTLLAAHSVPPEYSKEPDAYVDLIVEEMLPRFVSEGLIDAVDAFCEGIAFSPSQVDRIYLRAASLGLRVKGHADQLSNIGASRVVAKYRGLSADHLEYVDQDGASALADAGVVAVLLPGAFYFLSETRKPPVAMLREKGVEIAIATDANPGTSPIYSLPVIMNMASIFFGMTPSQTLRATTKGAALALGLVDRGGIDVGKRADLCVWNIDTPAEIGYYVGLDALTMRICNGKVYPCS